MKWTRNFESNCESNWPLNQVLLTLLPTWLGALTADTEYQQTVTGDAKSIVLSNAFTDVVDLITMEFKKLIALVADHMIVFGVTVVMLIDSTATKFKLSQQASVDELSQCTIHRGPTDVICLSLFG